MKLEELAKSLPKIKKKKILERLLTGKGLKKRRKKEAKFLERVESNKIVFCRRCGTPKAVIRKYGLYLCRRCFHQEAERMGWT
jgi:small subunit ribosomal protein S14